MTNLAVSRIRTAAPAGVGAVLAWLASLGLRLGAEAEVGLIAFLTALLAAAYYAIVRPLEARWPVLGWLLGFPSQPTYPETTDQD